MSGGTGTGLDFTIQIDATYDLSVDADRVEALVTVRATPGATPAPTVRIAEILIMDRSASMADRNQFHEARRAACAAIDALPEDALLGIIAGNRQAIRVFPKAGGLAKIDAETREMAKRAVMRLMPEGGTSIGCWLTAARELFADEAAAGGIRHAVLYTDGKNQNETREELDAALGACSDRFVCDVRGVGEHWDYKEVRHIADALQGDAVAILHTADLAEDFTRLMLAVQRIVVPRTYLRLSPSQRFRVTAIAQTKPDQVDLTSHQPADGTVIDVPLGSWDEQATREYQVSLRFDLDAIPVGESLRAARIDLLAEGADGTLVRCADAPLLVFRHATPGFQTVMPENLTRVENERELGLAIRACADAWLRQHTAEADHELNLACRLAHELDDVRLPLLARISDIGPDGKVRLRGDVTVGEMQKLGLDSTKTGLPPHRPRPEYRSREPLDSGELRPRRESPPPDEKAAARACDVCGEQNEGGDAYCAACGESLHGQVTS